MPSRAIRNARRGSQRADLPAKTKPAPADLVQNFDGRANTAAGKYEQRQDGDTQPDGTVIYWINGKS